MGSLYAAFCGLSLLVLREVNHVVVGPYMDEPFHVPQAQAYCKGEYATWDPKITTPPGLYVMSVLMSKIFAFKCTLPMLRLTTLLTLLSLPIALTRLVCHSRRIRTPGSLFSPSPEALVLSMFPLAWFFGFMYYTDVPGLTLVVWTVVSAMEERHWRAALIGAASCTIRQTNVVWVLYAYASSQLAYLHFKSIEPGKAQFHDPAALDARPGDIIRSIRDARNVVAVILPAFVPYALVFLAFGLFVQANGGITLGDKSNHIPAFHLPQLYYFVGCATFFGWPILVSGPEGSSGLIAAVLKRMFGSQTRALTSVVIIAMMLFTVHNFTIHHPFLLSDNRHYTFYIWRRIFMLHPFVPYALTPVYLAFSWAWFLRVGRNQTLLQTLLLPVLTLSTLLPAPLLEPRYFLVPYILLRSQVADGTKTSLILEAMWYSVVNGVTMMVFLYYPRGMIRFMW